MTKIITTFAVAIALNAGTLFAAEDYIIQIIEKDGSVYEIPATALEKVTFETETPTVNISDSSIALEDSNLSQKDTSVDERISATKYTLSNEDAEKLIKQQQSKANDQKNRI